MPAQINPGDLVAGNQRAFVLTPQLPAGDTFSEPTVVVNPASAGSVTLQPSVAGPAAGGVTPYTTNGVFVPATGYTGSVTLSAEVVGVDNQDAVFNIVAPPAPESVAFSPTGFVDTPISAGSTQAAA